MPHPTLKQKQPFPTYVFVRPYDRTIEVMSIKLLIVERSRLLREQLRASLEYLSALEIEVADDLQYGSRRFREWRPDIVIINTQYADGSGLDFLEMIGRECPTTRTLLLSDYFFFRKRSLVEGAEFFFEKSRGLGRLTQTVKRLTEAEK